MKLIRLLACVMFTVTLTVILTNGTAQSQGQVSVAVSPDQVDRYEVFVITVTTAYPNTTFDLTFGGAGYVLNRNGTTNAIGVWEEQLSAALDFGRYDVFVSALNETAQATLTVGCSARCVVDVQNAWGRSIWELISAGIFQVILVVVVVLLIVEGPKTAHYFWKTGASSVKHGQLTLGDRLKSPLAVFHGFVQPGRQSMRQDVNDRIAIDLRRRALLEELHAATQPKFMEYDPDHLKAVQDIAADLKHQYVLEGRVMSFPPPIAHKYERAEMNLGAEIEMLDVESKLDDRQDQRSRPSTDEVLNAHWARKDRKRQARRLRAAEVAFVLVGIPCALIAILGPLADRGVYVEFLRPFWNPIFGDAKTLLGALVAFALSMWLVYEAIRLRRQSSVGPAPGKSESFNRM